MLSSFRFSAATALVGVGLCLALAGLRIFNSVSFDIPLQLATSGAEWESLYPIWKAIQGEPVYTDRLKIPFSIAPYNWLFYQSYALFGELWMNVLSLSDAWLPTIGRFFTLIAVAAGSAIAFVTFKNSFAERSRPIVIVCLCFAIYVFAGPLTGWWVFTQRSDLWALVLDVAGIGLFLHFYPKSKLPAVLMLAVACYLAWSFKQMNVFAVGGAGLFLLHKRDWRSIFVLSAIMIGFWAAALYAGGQTYINTIVFADFALVFRLEAGLRNLANFAVKSTPTLAVLAVVGLMYVSSAAYRAAANRSDRFILSFYGLLVSLALGGAASFQTGAAENYFFSMSYFAALLAVSGLAIGIDLDTKPAAVGFFRHALVAGWALLSLAILAVFSGAFGVTDVRGQHVENTRWQACMSELPKPVFANYGYLMLPWMAPGQRPHFVVSFQYPVERAFGKSFERDGIGGLIEEGYFKSLALIVKHNSIESWDGGSLRNYRLKPTPCEDLAIYVHKSAIP